MNKNLLFHSDAIVSKREAIHLEAMNAAAEYREREVKLFEVLCRIEEKQIYYDMQITDIFNYCTDMLMLSRHVAYDFKTVVRKALEIPALKEAMLLEKTTVYKARRICSVINEKNADEWIGLAINCSSRVIEKCVALANPKAAIAERMTYVAKDTLQFQLAVSEEWSELLTSIKDLMSQKQMRAVSSEEALFMLMHDYKKKHDPILKAERAEIRAKKAGKIAEENAKARVRNAEANDESRAQKAEINEEERVQNAETNFESTATKSETNAEMRATESESSSQSAALVVVKRSRYIPAADRHALNRRDQNQCSFVDRHGKRCKEKRWLQKHHVVHFADGGEHGSENLQTLCWGHHCMEHRRN